jgi:hypothetical protein
MVAEVVEGGQEKEHSTVGRCRRHARQSCMVRSHGDDNAVMTMVSEAVETLDSCSDSVLGVDNAVITLLFSCANIAHTPVITWPVQ